jgi:hypothetical protein
MQIRSIARSLALATTVLMTVTVAHAEGDIYSRLMMMKEMDANKDGMLSKQEYLDMATKIWDMKADEVKAKGGMLTPAQFKELQKILGRTLG